MSASRHSNRRRILLFLLLFLVLLYVSLPRLVSLWLPGALRPFGFEQLDLRLDRPGPRAAGVEHLDFLWHGPDGLALRLRLEHAEYRYADDSLNTDEADLEILSWPVSQESPAATAPLSAWPVLPVRSLQVQRLHIRFPLAGGLKVTDGRLKAQIAEDLTSSLVLYVNHGLPDELPGRFELKISPDGHLHVSAGLSRGKTTSFFTEATLDAPPADAPPFVWRIAGDLRPFYRWLNLNVPDNAQIQAKLKGQLPTDYAPEGLLTGLKIDGDLSVQAKNWQLPQGLAKDFSAAGKLAYDRGHGQLELTSERVDALGVKLPAFAIDGRFERQPERVSGQATVSSSALSASIDADFDLKARAGSLRWRRLDGDLAGTLALVAANLPEAVRGIRIDQGRVRSTGSLGFRAKGEAWTLSPKLALNLRGVSGHVQALAFSGVDLDADLNSLTPLLAKASIEIDSLPLPAGIQLRALRGQARVSGSLAKPVVDAEAITAKTLGGSIALPAVHYVPGEPTLIPVHLDHLDFDALLRLADQEGLSGAGTVSGVLPVRWSPQGISLDEGAELKADGQGVLRYKPAAAEAIASGSQGSNIAMQALEDFRYKKMSVGVSYTPLGDYALKVALEGANPSLYNGYPIAFNLNLEGKLPGLLQAALLSGDFTQHLLKSLKDEEKHLKMP